MKKNLRQQIIDTSLTLFNEHGSHAISTNHIIDALHISPGSLYYYFHNKEEIIREILGQIITEFDVVYESFAKDHPVDKLIAIIEEMFGVYYKFRFFYLDIAMLMRKDKELQTMYKKNFQVRSQTLKSLIENLTQKGIFINLTEDQADALLNSFWMSGVFFFSYTLTKNEKITKKDIKLATKQFVLMLFPYFALKYQKEVLSLV